jgi:hypothetical protein
MIKKKSEHEKIERKLDLFLRQLDRVYPPLGKVMWRSFVAGAFGALGATIGLGIILFFAALILGQLQIIPGFDILIRNTPFEKILPTPTP